MGKKANKIRLNEGVGGRRERERTFCFGVHFLSGTKAIKFDECAKIRDGSLDIARWKENER